MNLFDWTLRFQGYDIAFAKAELARIQAIPERQYADHISQQKKAIVQYHLEHNAMYQKLTAGHSTADWHELPVLTKKHLQQPLNNRLSDGYSRTTVYVNKTSGSSGHPFVFAKDKVAHALTWAVIQDRFGWYDIDFNTSLQARFYGIPMDGLGYRKERLKDWLSHRYRFPIFDLSDARLEAMVRQFKTRQFVYINGYTSSIVLLAKYLKRQGLVLKDICPTLQWCMVTSEMLFDSDRTLLETYLGVPVVNEYGASELDLIAFQNRDGVLQLNSETLYIEVLDDDNVPVPLGQEGRIVITSLYNKAHPFIRYDIGDIGILSEASTPKKPILKKLIGRTNDIARLPSGKVIPGLTFYYVTKSVIEEGGNVHEFVVEQTAADAFTILYTSQRPFTDGEITTIKKGLTDYLEAGLRLSFERRERLDRSNRGKLKQFIGLPQL